MTRLVVALCAALLSAAVARADTVAVAVPGNANLYGSGHAAPPAPGGNGAGVLPTLIALPSGATTVRITSTSGSIDFGGCCPANGPDGVVGAGTAPSNDWDGLAGIDDLLRGRFLAGVFLDGAEPADPPPTSLSIPAIGFAALSPGIAQTFFMGDGLTGTSTGVTQVFDVPAGATRLFLGLHDAGPPDTSLPGWYGDNTGSFQVTLEISAATPVPTFGPLGAGIALLLLAACVLALRRRALRG